MLGIGAGVPPGTVAAMTCAPHALAAPNAAATARLGQHHDVFVAAQFAQPQLAGEDVEQIDGREVEHGDPPEDAFGGWVVVDACGGTLPARRRGPVDML
nr:hypothetical protein [Streptomyces noursei]